MCLQKGRKFFPRKSQKFDWHYLITQKLRQGLILSLRKRSHQIPKVFPHYHKIPSKRSFVPLTRQFHKGAMAYIKHLGVFIEHKMKRLLRFYNELTFSEEERLLPRSANL